MSIRGDGTVTAPTTQLEVDRLLPWLPAFGAACAACHEDLAVLSAICLRESGAGWAPGYAPQGKADGWGDHGQGFGLLQVDRRYHLDFIASATRADPEMQARMACRILHDAREWFRHSTTVAPEDVERCTIAAYNAGAGSVHHWYITDGDPDRATTGGDYSRDVLSRVAGLRALRPDLFPVVAMVVS